MTVHVRRIRSDEADVLRAVRLAALADAPSAFSADLATETAMTTEQWIERARRGAEGDDAVTFLAIDDAADGAPIGLVTGLHDHAGGQPTVELVSMWTAPIARRRGVGRALVAAVIAWADERSSPVELWVVRGNDGAEALYRSLGFVSLPTAERPTLDDPCRDELRLRRPRSTR